MLYRKEFFKTIQENQFLREAIKNGMVVVGRSKGGGESSIIALDIVRNFIVPNDKVYVGMLEAPKVGNKEYCKSVEKYIPVEHLYHVRYGADIVTMAPPFFHSPGKLIKFCKTWRPFSILDHAIGCYDEDKLYECVTKYEEQNDRNWKRWII